MVRSCYLFVFSLLDQLRLRIEDLNFCCFTFTSINRYGVPRAKKRYRYSSRHDTSLRMYLSQKWHDGIPEFRKRHFLPSKQKSPTSPLFEPRVSAALTSHDLSESRASLSDCAPVGVSCCLISILISCHYVFLSRTGNRVRKMEGCD